jgi:predicted CXXCH cytochrome family protein
LQIQQGIVNDAGMFIRQANGQNSCYGEGCHQEVDFSNATSTHQPFADGQCEHCHAPATHLQQVSLSTDDEIARCYECHSIESLGNSHPVGEKTIDPNTGEPMTCGTCHSPHYANKSNLLTLDGRGELCLRCHI